MSRASLLLVLLAACVSMRPVSASPTGVQDRAPAAVVDRALVEEFVAADDAARAALIGAHPEILSKPFREEFNVVGHDLRKRGDLASAERHFRAALFVALGYKFADTEAAALNNLGIVAGTRGDLAGAKQYFEQGLAVATAHNDLKTIQSSWGNLAILQRRAGDLSGALVSNEQALARARALDSPTMIAQTLNNIGNVYRDMGSGATALDYYVQSLALKDAIGTESVDVLTTLNNMGTIYEEQGDYALATDYYQRALSLLEQSGSASTAVAGALNNMGHVYAALGQEARAREYYTQSLNIADKVGDPVKQSTALYNLGNLERAAGRLKEAEALQRRSLAIRENGAELLGLIESLTEMGSLLTRDARPAEALPYLNRAVSLAQDSRLLNQLWKAQTSQGHTYIQLHQPDNARTSFEGAIATIETLRQLTAGGDRAKQRYFSDRVGPYYELSTLSADAGRPFEALSVIERARARALIDILASSRQTSERLTPEQRQREYEVTQAVLTTSSQLDAEVRKPRPNPQRLAALDTTLNSARNARDEFVAALYKARPDLEFARGNTPELTRERLAAVLHPGSAVVTFMVDDETTWVYLITSGADGPVVAIARLATPTPALLDLADQFARQVSSRDLAFAATSRRLYDALFGATDSALAGVSRLIVIPDGPLWEVPFQALQTPRGKFLVEERAVTYTPSITALATLEERQQAGPARAPYLLALGDPDTRTAGPEGLRNAPLGRLPEAAREVRALGQLYGAAHSRVLVAAQASETALRSEVSKASVLHIATHGVLDDRNPMYSHLVLTAGPRSGAPSENDHLSDGRLEAWELLDLGINADVAVLSACQTARGNGGFGEGIIGLSWSLFASGASTAVVSQWEVDSASTTNLMIAFHQRLLKPGAKTAGTAEALRQAALTLLKNPATRHPFYWAGFITVGAK